MHLSQNANLSKLLAGCLHEEKIVFISFSNHYHYYFLMKNANPLFKSTFYVALSHIKLISETIAIKFYNQAHPFLGSGQVCLFHL